MNLAILDLYSDYLICTWDQASATGLAKLLDNQINHDQVTRFLNQQISDSRELWRIVKPFVRECESEEGVVIVDDSVIEKAFSDENELITWHYDSSKERSVKGINIISILYYSQSVSLPICYDLVRKDAWEEDPKTRKQKRKSLKTKNQRARELLEHCQNNQIKFKYVLGDVFFASVENMNHIHYKLQKHFVMSIKDNRLAALTLEAKAKGQWKAVASLVKEANTTKTLYLKEMDFPVQCSHQHFKNDDGSEGDRYLVTDDLALDFEASTTIFQKRWKVEEYHKSLKHNAAVGRSPSSTIVAQSNHCFSAICAYIKLETLKTSTKLNHFALKCKLYSRAVSAAYEELRKCKPISFDATNNTSGLALSP